MSEQQEIEIVSVDGMLELRHPSGKRWMFQEEHEDQNGDTCNAGIGPFDYSDEGVEHTFCERCKCQAVAERLPTTERFYRRAKAEVAAFLFFVPPPPPKTREEIEDEREFAAYLRSDR